MADLSLTGGTEPRRNMLVPILLALVVLAALGAWFAKVFLHPEAAGIVTHTDAYPVHSVFEKPFGAVGEAQTEDALYIVAQVALTDREKVPLFLKDITGSFTGDDDSSYQANVIAAKDLPRLHQMFPKLATLTTAAGQPLTADSTVAPNTTGKGYIVMLFNSTEAAWQKRKSAEIKIDFYHQDTVALAVPK